MRCSVLTQILVHVLCYFWESEEDQQSIFSELKMTEGSPGTGNMWLLILSLLSQPGMLDALFLSNGTLDFLQQCQENSCEQF